jgi:outer membrane receptor protein involved in Fe transport
MGEKMDMKPFHGQPVAVAVAFALAAAAASAEPAREDRSIEEIVVTAQKRVQNLQDVPIVVTAISEQLLQDTGVRDIKDLTLLTPGLIVTSTSNESVTTARIRGVGTVGDNIGLESSVGIVIDGVYRPRNGVGFGDLGPVERIEVLKGPQGTLFGKNTSAGVINVITRRPSDEFRVGLELTGGNYDTLEGSAMIEGPFTDSWSGSLFAAHRERDGFYDISSGNGPRNDASDPTRNYDTFRGQLLYAPSESLDIRFLADYTKRDEECCLAPNVFVGPSGAIVDALSPDAGVLRPPNPAEFIAFGNRPDDQEIEDMGGSVEINWGLGALGDATLTSITAMRSWETKNAQESDFSSADLLYRPGGGPFSNQFDQLTQELRLAGQAGRVNWLVGAFYADEDIESRNTLLHGTSLETYVSLLLSAGTRPTLVSQLLGRPVGSSFAADLGQSDRYDQQSTSYALFTNESIAITDDLELTLGVRWTNEEKELDSHYFNTSNGVACATARQRAALINGALPPAAAAGFFALSCATFGDPIYNDAGTRQSRDEDEWSGTVKLNYDFTDDFMAYVSYARGYKAGGFNLDRERTGSSPADPATQLDADTAFDKETVDSYEIGFKSNWLDDTLLVNATYFDQTYEGFQLNTYTGLQFIVTSIPEVTSKGFDFDFVWLAPIEELTIQGGVTNADTKYADFTPGPGVSPRLPNNRLSFAPEWSATVSATYEQDISANLLWRANLGVKWMSEYNTGSDLNPLKLQPSYALMNARVGFGRQDDRWMVELWGQNVTDERYYQVGFDATLQTGTINAFMGQPRTYGATLRVMF